MPLKFKDGTFLNTLLFWVNAFSNCQLRNACNNRFVSTIETYASKLMKFSIRELKIVLANVYNRTL